MTITLESERTRRAVPGMVWLDLTRKCQLGCSHCFNESGPAGEHGTMTRDDWVRVLDQAAACGIRRIQLIGGEPTMHPDAAHLAEYALTLGLDVEVFSNLVHVTARWWDLFQRDGISVATSYYSDDPAEHNTITGRPSHRLTRANIVRAVQLGVPLRAGIIETRSGQRVAQARRDLEAIGVTRIRVDRVRRIDRAAEGQPTRTSELCGRCGDGRASVGPTGDVSPCAMASWMSVGNVREASLADIVSGTTMAQAVASITAAPRGRWLRA
ncbi:radical SAM/SPASM domain-containing protein [Actinomadura sp. KC06]|uniref:radical SAM/SPASM domain-containing protein n=1 Tax=Actinomadura sp. KC06 TaxID=2530369 RepID=UPI001FB7E581|nr:radical SAM/SPASM domain-containing protein [Actinomadura sp. KC06]